MNLQEYSHHRRNALAGEWVLVSPHDGRLPVAELGSRSSHEIRC